MSLPAERKNFKISLFNLTVLMHSIYEASKDKDIGFQDMDNTLNSLISQLSYEVHVHQSNVESALWSANMLAEKKKFWHPKGYTFDQFLSSVSGGRYFNKDYNYFE